MNASTAEPKKALGVRVTAEQHRILTEAARREHRSVSNFVLEAAMRQAAPFIPQPKRSREEISAILRRAQEAMQRANPTGRSLVDELMEERRAEAARE